VRESYGVDNDVNKEANYPQIYTLTLTIRNSLPAQKQHRQIIGLGFGADEHVQIDLDAL
jgi:hypothetical protein